MFWFFFFPREKFLCDVTLITTNLEEFPAHRAILASCSPYFHAMFSCFEESHQNKIVLQDVDPKALSLLLDYVYTAEIQVNEDNVQVFFRFHWFYQFCLWQEKNLFKSINRSSYQLPICCKWLTSKKLVANFSSPSCTPPIVLEFARLPTFMAA